MPHRFFTHGQRAYGDRHVYAARSRFIPEALLGLFDCTTWPAAAQETGDSVQSRAGPRVDVAARMRDMWG